MKLLSTRRRKALATFATVTVTALAGLVFAAWLTDGEGPGGAQAGQLQAPTVEAQPTSSPDAGCLPGGPCQGLFRITNPNARDLRITAVHPPVTPGGTSSNMAACPPSNLAVNDQTLGTPITVPASETTDVTIPATYMLAADAPSECQGVTFTRRARLTFSTTP